MEHMKQDYLSSLYQNARVGMQSIHDVLKDVENPALEKLLRKHFAKYEAIAKDLKVFAKKEALEIKDNNWFEKARLFTTTKMSVMFDDSTRNIISMFLLGTTMGLVQLVKDKTDYKNVDDTLDDIREELSDLQEQNYKELIKLLKESK